MKRVGERDLKPWVTKVPLLGRVAAVILIPCIPLFSLWEDRKLIMEAVAHHLRVAFCRWEDE